MAQHGDISTSGPGAFSMSGGPVGCLLLHGFSGSPMEMLPVGEFLNTRGLTVVAPLLPGHGTRPDDLNGVTWQDWIGAGEDAYRDLSDRCEIVFLAGLSMGALVATHLAIMYPDVAGLVLYSPAIRLAQPLLPLAPLLKHVIKQFPRSATTDLTDPDAPGRLWHYETYPVGGAAELLTLQRVVRGELGDVGVPSIVFYSTGDSRLHPSAGQMVFEGLGSEEKELVTLHNSGHCITVDSERESLFARTYGFIVRHTNGRL